MASACLRHLVVASAALAGMAGCVHAPRSPGAPRAPTDYAAAMALARLVERQGRAEAAARGYRELAHAHPREAGPLHRLAILEAGQGRRESAEALFRRAVSRAPGDVELLNDFGYWLATQGRPAEAEAVLRAALAIRPDHPLACNNLGDVVARQGRFAEGLDLFRRGGGEADAHANLAFILARLGHLDGARRHYRRALRLDPTLRPAAEALAQLDRPPADPEVQTAGGSRAAPPPGPGAPAPAS
jgi:Tfp pilus assembly protein PilF